LAEIFLQNLEDEFYPTMMHRRNTIFTGRYVDDILVIYDGNTTTAEDIFDYHKRMQGKARTK
jgi:hypothetical protein